MLRAAAWLRGSGWSYCGNETKEELAALENALAKATEWMAAWLNGLEPRWLILIGKSGTGKTKLVKRICEYVWNYGKAVYERTELIHLEPDPAKRHEGHLYFYRQQGHPFKPWELLVPHNEDNRERLDRTRHNWISAIDDLKPQTGEERTVEVRGSDGKMAPLTGVVPKRFEITAAGDLLDHRLRKWTMITSNLTRPQIAALWDTRIASRMMRDDAVLVDLTGVRDFDVRLAAIR